MTELVLFVNEGTNDRSKSHELPENMLNVIKHTDDSTKLKELHKKRKQHVDDYLCNIQFDGTDLKVPPLLFACLHNRPAIIEFLLEERADIQMKDDFERNALYYLCASKSEDSISEAFITIRQKLPLNELANMLNSRETVHGSTAFFKACSMGRRDVVKCFVEAVKFLDRTCEIVLQDEEGMTALHHVCASPLDVEPDMIDDIIKSDMPSDVHARDNKGRTPFLLACEHARTDLARKLLDAKSDVYAVDNSQMTALHYLSASNSDRIEDFLTHISKQTRRSSIEECQERFINRKDKDGRTPLVIALKEGNMGNVKILIKYGADVNVLIEGHMPLQYVCQNMKPNEDLAVTLIKHGADLSVSVDGGPLLHYACKYNFVNMVESLLEKSGADIVMEKNEEGKRPFYYVKSYEVERMLTRKGAIDTKERDPQLLDECCDKGYSDSAIYLIENIDDGVRAQHLIQAVSFNYPRIAMALMKHRNWYNFLRVTFENLECQHEHTTPFREMIKKMPAVAEFVLDKCIVSNPTHSNQRMDDFSVLMNYEFLEDFASPSLRKKLQVLHEKVNLNLTGFDYSYSSIKNKECCYTEWGPLRFTKTNHPLSIMVEHKRESLLNHPVVGSLLRYKWTAYCSLYLINIITYCLFLGCLTAYALIIRNPLDSICQCADDKNCSRSIINSSNATNTEYYGTGQRNVTPLSIFVILLAVGRFLVKIVIIIYNCCNDIKKRYTCCNDIKKCYTCSNAIILVKILISITLYITAICFVSSFRANYQCLNIVWQWPMGVLAVTLGWIHFIILISKVSYLGIYVLILQNVFFTFMKVILLTSLLVITFSLPFYMTFHEPDILHSPFSTPGKSILKTVTMTTGEFEYDNIFRLSPDQEEGIPYKRTAYTLWIVFVIVMPILLANMLVGLAVDDIEKIRREATLAEFKLKVDYILSFDEMKLFKKSVPWRELWPNKNFSSIPAATCDCVYNWSNKFINWLSEEKYEKLSDVLKSKNLSESYASRRLSTDSKVADIKQQVQEYTATLSADIADLKQELQTNQKELTEELKHSQEDLKRAVEFLTLFAKKYEVETGIK